MRCLSAAAIKRMNKGGLLILQEAPTEGSKIRVVYDILKANPGKPVVLKLNKYQGRVIYDLQDYYGLDIRYLGRDINNRAEHMLAGEWFGKVYIDYVAENMEKERTMTKAPVPDGVHTLSQESIDALQRAAIKGAAIAAKHLKRES